MVHNAALRFLLEIISFAFIFFLPVLEAYGDEGEPVVEVDIFKSGFIAVSYIARPWKCQAKSSKSAACHARETHGPFAIANWGVSEFPGGSQRPY